LVWDWFRRTAAFGTLAIPLLALRPLWRSAIGIWQQSFGSDVSAIGWIIHLNGRPVEIVGILPPEFSGLSPASLCQNFK
jgi:hypothetical protein